MFTSLSKTRRGSFFPFLVIADTEFASVRPASFAALASAIRHLLRHLTLAAQLVEHLVVAVTSLHQRTAFIASTLQAVQHLVKEVQHTVLDAVHQAQVTHILEHLTQHRRVFHHTTGNIRCQLILDVTRQVKVRVLPLQLLDARPRLGVTPGRCIFSSR